VVVELKNGDFKLEYTVKLNFYISAADDLLKTSHDNPTIGFWNSLNSHIYRVEITNSGEFNVSVFADVSEYLTSGYQLRQLFMVPWMSYMFRFSNRIIIAATNGYVVEVYNPTNTPYGSANFNSILGSGVSEDHYYLSALNSKGEPSLYKIKLKQDLLA
jgi:hypothetical protein